MFACRQLAMLFAAVMLVFLKRNSTAVKETFLCWYLRIQGILAGMWCCNRVAAGSCQHTPGPYAAADISNVAFQQHSPVC